MLLLIEKYLFYFFLFSIPFQTRKILWYEGWRFNEWQSASIYLTDLLLIGLFLFWLCDYFLCWTPKLKIKNEKLKITVKNLKVYEYFLFVFIIISAISITNSTNLIISWFQWFKLLEFATFFFYLKNYAIYKFGFINLLFAILWGGFFQATIAIGQFLKQESLGLAFLGESVFNKDIIGIASFYLPTSEKIIRAYGTTPHSNILAAYLFLALFCFYFIWFYKRSGHDHWFLIVHLITLWAFFLTFSRAAIFLLGTNYIIRGLFLFIKFKKLKSRRLWQIIIHSGIVIFLFTIIYWPEVVSRIKISGQEDAVQLRNFYNQETLQWLSLTGIGVGNFVNELTVKIPNLPIYMYQPVHNIYLLIYSETGVLGISVFVLFLIFLVRDFVLRTRMERFHHYSLLLLFSSFLFMGLFDHFLWTLQQGRFLFWLVLATLAIDESDDVT